MRSYMPLPALLRRLSGLLLVLTLGLAQAAPLGPAIVVAAGGGAQSAPSVAVDAAGRSVIVWHEQAAAAVFARRFAADGSPLGEAIVVDARPDNRRDLLAEVAMTADGGFVVAWQRVSAGLPEGPTTNLIRRFSADGLPLEGARVLDIAGPVQLIGAPALAGDGSGNHVVVWSRFTTVSRVDATILPRRHDHDIVRGVSELVIEHRAADGSLRAPQAVVDALDTVERSALFSIGPVRTFLNAEQAAGGYDVTMNAVGEAAVAWSDERYLEAGTLLVTAGAQLATRTVNLHARRYAATTTAITGPLPVSSITTIGRAPTRRSPPVVALDRSGGITVAWADLPLTLGLETESDIHALRIEADGRRRLRSMVGNGEGFLSRAPAIAAFDDGRALVSFTQSRTLDVVTRALGATGRVEGAVTEVADSVRVSGVPVLAARGDGGHVVVWSASGVLTMRRYGPP